jgi:hypothetical protein
VGHIDDRWNVTGADGRRVRSARYGSGLRWRVRYVTGDGRERSKSFRVRTEAERFLNATAA